ncbi:hypothetical protein CC85DRAFT_330400 [Cutaneotrichosporon oleaginosum]|uniref:Uncharacterized protein n=1 Tax=Cutaneotrichosporon oleaginosum TaxID=879819 RepID=A0A0J0XFL7_9TREE|nr:uncharacterized protein CC85DRAFT_330400 [Cutaneotrichosporon oleaginosum]KLT39867.1 hypothetical protein CC85DRAFT_330400 [Cutaneotrichosporon oleaginosum]TXT05464.1 hypothetical protein COLE_06784 [Cutaneotrichosporon oleaginosum]
MASISSPTQLATFQNAQASSSRLPHVQLAPVHGSRGRLAVAAVNADGVWTYDIKTLRPTATYTVPPSTGFTSAPLSFIPGDDDEARVTVVGATSEKEGGAIWIWVGEEDKRSVKAGVVAIHGCMWPLLVVGGTGALFLLDAELQLSALTTPKPKAGKVLSSALVGSRAVIVDDRGKITVYALDLEAGSASLLAEVTAASSYLAASAGEVIAAIDSNHRLHARKLSEILENADESPGIAIANPTTPLGVLSLPYERPLAALTTSHDGAGVTIVSASADLPAALATSHLSTGGSQVTNLAVLSTFPLVLGAVQTHAGTNGRSIIHTMDVTLPPRLGLAQLLGSATATADVLRLGHQASGGADKLLDAVSSALKAGEAARAENTFTTWLEDEEKRAPGRRFVIPESVARRLVDMVLVNKPYAGKIIHTLIDRRQLHEDMREGGVVTALLPLDRLAVSRLLRKNPALPARSVVALLVVDDKVLESVVSGPAPDPSYRAELKRQLNADAACRMLVQLTAWAEAHATRDDGLGSWLEKQPKSSLPPLTAVVAHASALLDAHLPSLLEKEDELTRLSEAIAPVIAAQTDYRRLRAPIDATLRAHAAKKEEAGTDNRRRQYKQDKMADEAFGKWRVEDFVF